MKTSAKTKEKQAAVRFPLTTPLATLVKHIVKARMGEVRAASKEGAMTTFDAFWGKRGAAESAAKVVVRYMISTGKNVAGLLDQPLRDAVTHEMSRYQSR